LGGPILFRLGRIENKSGKAQRRLEGVEIILLKCSQNMEFKQKLEKIYIQ
jgi:hypothetical protein